MPPHESLKKAKAKANGKKIVDLLEGIHKELQEE